MKRIIALLVSHQIYQRSFDNILDKQIPELFENILSKYQTGFWKEFSAQNCLVAMVDKIRKILDHGGKYAALFTDLSKAFDCHPRDLLYSR